MRCGDTRLRFFGGRDGDDQAMTVQSDHYIDTLEHMGREWSTKHDGLAFVPIGTPDWLALVTPNVVPALRGRVPRRQYRYG